MPSPEEQPPRAVTEALARLEERLHDIEFRLARLEGKGIPAAPAAAPAPPRAPFPPRPAAGRVRRGEFEVRMGLTWVNRIGVVTLLLGAAFFFRYAAERGWIGEGTRVLLGSGVGLLGIAAGEKTWRSGQRTYAQGITAAGTGILFLALYAAFGMYHLIPEALDFLLLAGVTAGAGLLALRYDAAPIAALSLLAGYLTPVLLDAGDWPWLLFGFVLLLDVVAVGAAARKHWRGLRGLALAATALIFGGHIERTGEPGRQAMETLFAFAYYGLFATPNSLWIYLPAQLLAALAISSIWGFELLPYAVFALAVAAAGLVIADLRCWPAGVPVTLAGFWLAYSSWYPQAPQARPLGPAMAVAAAGFALFLAWTPWRALARRAVSRPADLLAMAWNAAAFFGAAWGLLIPEYRGTVAGLAILLACAYAGTSAAIWRPDRRAGVLAAAIAWVLLVLAAPIQLSGYRVTLVWALEAAAMAWTGSRFRERLASWLAAALFVMVVLRLALVDSDMYASPAVYHLLFNGRFLTFLTAAASLWVAAWVAQGRQALAPYVGGHVILLWALGLEALGWAARAAAPENLRNLQTASISILAGAYAAVLVTAGVSSRSAVNRTLGLVLVALIVAKLYLYDVWLLGLFYRMAAFAVLGALLIGMSYAYSRSKSRSESADRT